jgi:hypothetical protein
MSEKVDQDDRGTDDPDGKFYTFFVDGEEYQTEESALTCGEIMDIAGIPRDVGLIHIRDDGTEEQCEADEIFEFEGPGRRFKKAPRFRRG